MGVSSSTITSSPPCPESLLASPSGAASSSIGAAAVPGLGSPKGLFQELLKKRAGFDDTAGASSQSDAGSSTRSCEMGGGSMGSSGLLGVGLAAGALAATGLLEPVTMVFVMVEAREQLKVQHAAHIRCVWGATWGCREGWCNSCSLEPCHIGQ